MSLPSSIRAVEISEYGGPDVLVPVSLPLPQLADDQVLIKNLAVGVNRPDCVQRKGNYPVPPDADPLPGLEVAGEIVAIGGAAGDWAVGDRVTALTHGGGYAEFTAVHHGHCLPWPDGFDAILAAAIPETFFTVYYNAITRAQLKEGEKILIHGGSSGIGSTAIQIAKALGAEVITTAGTQEKCAFCKALGADLAINYKSEDWVECTRDFTAGYGVDVVLDMVAGDYIQRNLELLARDGRYALIAFLGGRVAETNFGPILGKRLTITGSTLRPQTTDEKATIAQDLYREIWPLMDDGTIKPHIHATFPLEEAAKAHALMESGAHLGKIILTCG